MAAAKQVTRFTPPVPQVHQQIQQGTPAMPFVHPGAAMTPEAQAYAAGMAARQQGRGFQKYSAGRPVAPIAIPPLEQAPVDGAATMSQQAAMFGPRPGERAATAAVPSSIIEGPPPGGWTTASERSAASPGAFQLTDALPPEAQEDPAFIQGQGSMMAANQPNLALKYGVIRGGVRIPPSALRGETTGRRSMQDTLKDLSSIANAQKPEDTAKGEPDYQEANFEKQVVTKDAAPKQEEKEEQKKKIAEAIDKLDDFDYDELRHQMNKDNLNNPEQRRIIEGRLKPLDISELIQHDRVRQDVPVIPNKFWITFQSLTGDDDMELKRLIMSESKKVEVTDRYLLDKYAFMSLTAGLLAINNRLVPHNQYDADGNFNADKFWLKYGWVMRRPLHMLASIGVNHTWFEMRVRGLFEAEKVKNG